MTLELDIPALLLPFEDNARCGEDLRSDDDPNNAYRQIRDARNEARDVERQADLVGEPTSGAKTLWIDVWENGQEYLKSQAKDLEIVAYMIEASVRLGGFRGLACALRLTGELLNSFWGELLPTPDEEGIETTLRPLSRLNGDVITYPLMRVPVTEDTAAGAMVVWQYSQAKQLESLAAEERERRVSSGAVTLEKFNRAVSESSDGFFRDLAAQIQEARKEIKQLGDILETRAGDDEAPNLSRFVKAVDDAESVLQQIAGKRLAVKESPVGTTEASTAGASAVAGSSATGTPGKIGGREGAFELLETVAKWFDTHEPQSILPSEIRKAIRRGKMSPLELYGDLIGDTEIRRQLFRDIGIEVPQDQ